MAEDMIHAQTKPRSQAAVFARSLEQVLHVLIRLIIGRLSLAKLQELIRNIYVKEAEARLKEESPKSRVTLSQLALLTGIDTRTLTKVTNDAAYSQSAYKNEDFLNEMTPETAVLSIWMSDSRFIDEATGKPLVLSLNSGSRSFETLVKTALSGRGFTYKPILARLESAKSIEVDRDKERVRLITNNYFPFLSADESALLDVGFSTTVALLRTIAANIDATQEGEELLFQRIAFTYSLSPRHQAKFRQRIREFLTRADEECKELMAEMEESTARPEHLTAGVSMFYFELADGA